MNWQARLRDIPGCSYPLPRPGSARTSPAVLSRLGSARSYSTKHFYCHGKPTTWCWGVTPNPVKHTRKHPQGPRGIWQSRSSPFNRANVLWSSRGLAFCGARRCGDAPIAPQSPLASLQPAVCCVVGSPVAVEDAWSGGVTGEDVAVSFRRRQKKTREESRQLALHM